MNTGTSNPPPEASTSGASKPAKRGARACLSCRRLKKTCSGNYPCERCVKNSVAHECQFDKPGPNDIEDHAKSLERLAAMELMMSQMMDNIAHINKNVAQILNHQQAQSFGGSPPDPRSSSYSQPPSAPPSGPGIPIIPTSCTTLLDTTSIIPRHYHSVPPPVPTGSEFGSLQSHVSPAVDETAPPEVRTFEWSLDTPIEALARASQAASQLLPAEQSRLTEESQLAEHGPGAPEYAGEGSGANYNDDERPRKRTRIAFLPTKTTSVDQRDVVSKGLVSDRQARLWYDLFMNKLQPYCIIVNPIHDTYDSVRQRSHVLFNTLLYLAARTDGGANPPSPTLVAVAGEIRSYAQTLIFETSPPIDVIQTLILMAVWHDEPYMLSGYALRMAASTRLELTFAHFDAHGWDKTDPKAHHLMARLRCLLYLLFLDFKHSACTGRLILVSPLDIEEIGRNADKIFLSPLSTQDDNRMVANLKLTMLHRKIILSSPPIPQSPIWDPSEHIQYHQTVQHVLQKWFDSYDSALASEYPADFYFSRRSHLRQLCDGKLVLAGLVFKRTLLDRSAHPAIVEVAHDAFQFARASMHTVLQSTAYRDNAKYCGYLTRVDLSFAGLMALKLAALYPELVEAHEIVSEVMQVADLISNCSGSQKYCMALRVAADNFIQKTGPSRGDPGPFADPLSALHELSNTQQASSTSNALLPGEVEIDWTSLAESFVDTSDLLNAEWIPYQTLSTDNNENWFTGFGMGTYH